jgi:hypothetical protein
MGEGAKGFFISALSPSPKPPPPIPYRGRGGEFEGRAGEPLRKTSPGPHLNLLAEVTHGNVQRPAGAYLGVVAVG